MVIENKLLNKIFFIIMIILLVSTAFIGKVYADYSDEQTIFKQPQRDTDKDVTGDVIKDADSFIESGKDVGDEDGYIDETQLQNFSQTLYSILFGIGVAIAVIVGMIIGIKLMIAPIGERAEAKKLLIPYAVGCVIVFGAFGIWQLAVTIMQGF